MPLNNVYNEPIELASLLVHIDARYESVIDQQLISAMEKRLLQRQDTTDTRSLAESDGRASRSESRAGRTESRAGRTESRAAGRMESRVSREGDARGGRERDADSRSSHYDLGAADQERLGRESEQLPSGRHSEARGARHDVRAKSETDMA